jgi:hypothetical protein
MALKSFPCLKRMITSLPFVAALGTADPAGALIFSSSGEVGFNSTAPTGPLAGSGWQYQGSWYDVLGTPVAPGYFLTAKHVGGAIGDSFTYQGSPYATTARIDHPTADLTLWKVSGTFPSYAPLYSGNSEAGKGIVLFGRSAVRGAEVNVPGASPTPLRGWRWGSAGYGVIRWGENQVDATEVFGGADYLVAGFSYGAGVNEATLATGDSGGGVFILDGGIWKLAGINSKVVSTVSFSPVEPTFQAAIFDLGGLYASTTSGLVLIPDELGGLEAFFLSTRVSTYANWVQTVTAVPEPGTMALWAGLGLTAFAGWRRSRTKP